MKPGRLIPPNGSEAFDTIKVTQHILADGYLSHEYLTLRAIGAGLLFLTGPWAEACQACIVYISLEQSRLPGSGWFVYD